MHKDPDSSYLEGTLLTGLLAEALQHFSVDAEAQDPGRERVVLGHRVPPELQLDWSFCRDHQVPWTGEELAPGGPLRVRTLLVLGVVLHVDLKTLTGSRPVVLPSASSSSLRVPEGLVSLRGEIYLKQLRSFQSRCTRRRVDVNGSDNSKR